MMIAAEYALPIPGSASRSSALAELMSSRSDLAAGAIFDSVAGAFGAGAILLSDLAAGCAVCAIDVGYGQQTRAVRLDFSVGVAF